MKMQWSLLLLCTSLSFATAAQTKLTSVIASGGETSESSKMRLEWTLGEPVVETFTSAAGMYTQGFHQPVLQIRQVASPLPFVRSLRIYPNPSLSVIYIQLHEAAGSTLFVSLFDANGKQVAVNRFPPDGLLLKMDISRLTQGLYFLRVTDAGGVTQGDYKVIKMH